MEKWTIPRIQRQCFILVASRGQPPPPEVFALVWGWGLLRRSLASGRMQYSFRIFCCLFCFFFLVNIALNVYSRALWRANGPWWAKIARVWATLSRCWTICTHVEPILWPFQKRWNTYDSKQKKNPKLKLNRYCNCFLLMCAQKTPWHFWCGQIWTPPVFLMSSFCNRIT